MGVVSLCSASIGIDLNVSTSWFCVFLEITIPLNALSWFLSWYVFLIAIQSITGGVKGCLDSNPTWRFLMKRSVFLAIFLCHCLMNVEIVMRSIEADQENGVIVPSVNMNAYNYLQTLILWCWYVMMSGGNYPQVL